MSKVSYRAQNLVKLVHFLGVEVEVEGRFYSKVSFTRRAVGGWGGEGWELLRGWYSGG